MFGNHGKVPVVGKHKCYKNGYLCYKKEPQMLQKEYLCYKREAQMLQKGRTSVTKRTRCYKKDSMLQKGMSDVTKRKSYVTGRTVCYKKDICGPFCNKICYKKDPEMLQKGTLI